MVVRQALHQALENNNETHLLLLNAMNALCWEKATKEMREQPFESKEEQETYEIHLQELKTTIELISEVKNLYGVADSILKKLENFTGCYVEIKKGENRK